MKIAGLSPSFFWVPSALLWLLLASLSSVACDVQAQRKQMLQQCDTISGVCCVGSADYGYDCDDWLSLLEPATVTINVQLDDYPNEINWILEQFIEEEAADEAADDIVSTDEEILRFSFRFGFFDDELTPTTAEIILEDVEGVLCQTQYFMSRLVQNATGSSSIHVKTTEIEWGYFQDEDLPAQINFTAEFTDATLMNVSDVNWVDDQVLINAMEALGPTGLQDFITEWIWNAEPVGLNFFMNANRAAFDGVRQDPVEGILQEVECPTTVVPSIPPTFSPTPTVAVADEDAASIISATRQGKPEPHRDDWVALWHYFGPAYQGPPDVLQKTAIGNLSPNSRFRFSIWDTQGDGVCCMYGNGWAAITTTTTPAEDNENDDDTMIWSIKGNHIKKEPTRVYFTVDASGTVEIEAVETPPPTPVTVSTPGQAPVPIPNTVATFDSVYDTDDDLVCCDDLNNPAPGTVNFFGVSYSTSSTTTLDLTYDGLTGTLPNNIGDFTALTYLNIGDNQISGTLPTELASMTQLTHLDLGPNSLTGTLPTEIGLLTNLEWFSMWNNQLSGTVPTELGLLTELTEIYFTDNLLSGPIPSEIGLLTALTRLDVGDNLFLSGTVPESVCALQDSGLTIIVDCKAVVCCD